MTLETLLLANKTDQCGREATHWLNRYEDNMHPIMHDVEIIPDHVIEEVRRLAVKLMQQYQQDMNDKLADL